MRLADSWADIAEEKADRDNSLHSCNSFRVETPRLSERALFGLPGEIVRKIEPHTETHPAALLVQFLIGFGNAVGRSPFVYAERDKHHANLFGVIVGETSRGRKGTSWTHVRHILGHTDLSWESNRIMGGLASGEGVIAELRDEEGGESKDKRLLLMEPEFAQVLRVMQRDGNTLSVLMRNAWDSGRLRNMSKGSPLRADDCHISMICHITRKELSRLLTENDAANGFANRILYCHSKRTKLLPDGGEIHAVDFSKEIGTLHRVVQLARQRGEMRRTLEAREYWREIYPELTKEIEGRWGDVTSRAEAQVIRLSLIYCLLDGGSEIGIQHLKAAEALWGYCSESARWAFMEFRFSRHAQLILDAISEGPLTLTQLSDKVFKRNLTHAQIDEAMREIAELIGIEKRKTAGRDAVLVSLKRQV
jgi:hypothetical protein